MSNETPLQFKDFTMRDWYAWSGKERPIGGQPLICKTNKYVIIIDANGIGVYFTEEVKSGYGNHFFLESKFNLGVIVAEYLTEEDMNEEKLIRIGFVKYYQ